MSESEIRQKRFDEDRIDVAGLMGGLWRRRLLIAGGTLLLTVAAAITSLILPRMYRSQGMISLGAVSLPDYRRLEVHLHDASSIRELLRRSDHFDDAEKAAIGVRLRSQHGLSQRMQWVQAMTPEELRRLPSAARSEDAAAVIGLRLNWSDRDPATAVRMVRLLARHVGSRRLYDMIYRYIEKGYLDAHQAVMQIEKDIDELRFNLESKKILLADLERIGRAYPTAMEIKDTQVLTLEEGGHRFFPLVVQKVGLEVDISEMKQTLEKLNRDLERNTLRLELFSGGFRQIGELPPLGESALDMLKSIHAGLRRNQDPSLNHLKLFGDELERRIQFFEFAFQESLRFLSGPSVPARPFKPQRKKIGIGAFLLSAGLMLMLALILNWWEKNRARVTARSNMPK